MRDRVQKLWATGKSPGWAALDRKQRQKQCLEPDLPTETYPSISGVVNSVLPLKSSEHINSPSGKSFSRVVQTPAFSSLILSNYDTSSKGLMGSNSERTAVIEKEANLTPYLEKLKGVHSWADANLIEDILGAVNNDFDQAALLLESMAASSSSEGIETINLGGQSSPSEEAVHNKKAVLELAAFENKSSLSEMKSGLEDCIDSNKTGEASKEALIETMLSGSSTHSKSVPHPLVFAPIEPEWEEDDVYLTHRKDALKAIRSAAQHSRAASNAYLRGDHFSAKQLSQKAQGEWEAANMLNAKVAAEILSIRNNEVDVWKLDLHGLHASEAVRTLQEHLRRVETNVPFNSLSPCRISEPEAEHSNAVGTMKTQKKQVWQGPRVLQVITGTGKHSRGEAALPSAVRSYLIESGYRFDEARPGVIAVRPKFRCQRFSLARSPCLSSSQSAIQAYNIWCLSVHAANPQQRTHALCCLPQSNSNQAPSRALHITESGCIGIWFISASASARRPTRPRMSIMHA